MAYGLQVLTSTGVKSTFDLNTARIIRLYHATVRYGSASIPEFDSNKGDYVFLVGSYAAYPQALSWNNSTKVITWYKHNGVIPDTAYSSNFYILFSHYK